VRGAQYVCGLEVARCRRAAAYHRLVDVDAGHNLTVAGASQLHDELEFRAELAQPSPLSLNTLKSEVVIL
jgi:hypothetical protein